MPKATAIHTTIASGLNRRGLLTGAAAAIAVPTALPALANTSQHSPEFVAYRKRRAQYHASFEGNPEETDAHIARQNELNDALWDCVYRIMERKPRRWSDVAELAHVVETQLWVWDIRQWDGWRKHSHNELLERSLIDAIFAMAEGK